MTKPYDKLVFIGRFQPPHNAHIEIIRQAASLAEKVIVIIGSANQSRTYKNPFTVRERRDTLKCALGKDQYQVQFAATNDTLYNDQAWAVRVQTIVAEHSRERDKIAIIGHEKDESSFYLKMFPQWERVEVGALEPLNASDIRAIYFNRQANLNYLLSVVPPGVFDYLKAFHKTAPWEQIVREREFIENYKRPYAALPYEPIFVTTDAVVICSGHVLMIKRRSEPGKGLWALPGGFVNAKTDRSVQDAAIRELREETGIKVPAPVLVGSIQDTRVFDAIDRSARGRTITHAFKIVLPDGDLPKVKGADDAEKAKWIPVSDVTSGRYGDNICCYEDHAEIISYFIGA